MPSRSRVPPCGKVLPSGEELHTCLTGDEQLEFWYQIQLSPKLVVPVPVLWGHPLEPKMPLQ